MVKDLVMDSNTGKNEEKKQAKWYKKITQFEEFGILVALIIICALIAIANPIFLSFGNIMNVLMQISLVSIMAVGAAFVIITGGIDLSVGSSLTLGGVLAATFYSLGFNPWIALFLAVLMGSFVGAMNGLLIVKLNINPFITTMAMASVIKGLAYLITGGMPLSFNTEINFLGGGTFFSIPVPVIIMLIIILFGHVLLTKTIFGKYVFAVGGNEKSAKLSGVDVHLTKIKVYSLLGALGALAGVITACNLRIADTAAGNGREMDVIAAVVIGGASLSGGKGSIKGVLIGAAIMGVIRNGFVLLRLSSYLQLISIGAVIVIAVAIDQMRKKK